MINIYYVEPFGYKLFGYFGTNSTYRYKWIFSEDPIEDEFLQEFAEEWACDQGSMNYNYYEKGYPSEEDLKNLIREEESNKKHCEYKLKIYNLSTNKGRKIKIHNLNK